jgi:hypothetical protein
MIAKAIYDVKHRKKFQTHYSHNPTIGERIHAV